MNKPGSFVYDLDIRRGEMLIEHGKHCFNDRTEHHDRIRNRKRLGTGSNEADYDGYFEPND